MSFYPHSGGHSSGPNHDKYEASQSEVTIKAVSNGFMHQRTKDLISYTICKKTCMLTFIFFPMTIQLCYILPSISPENLFVQKSEPSTNDIECQVPTIWPGCVTPNLLILIFLAVNCNDSKLHKWYAPTYHPIKYAIC